MNIFFTAVSILIVLFILYVISRRLLSSASPDSYTSPELEILEIKILKEAEDRVEVQGSALAAENLFASLHGLLREELHLQEHFSFEMVASKESGLRFFVAAPSSIIRYVEGQIYAQYPEAQIKIVEDYAKNLNFDDISYEVSTLSLSKADFFPIKTYKDLEVDPLAAVTSTMAQVSNNEQIMVQYLVKPIGDVWQDAGHLHVNNVRDGISNSRPGLLSSTLKTVGKEALGLASSILTGMFKYEEFDERAASSKKDMVKLTPVQDLQITSIEDKLGKMGFEVEIRVVSAAPTLEKAETRLRLILAPFRQLSAASLNSFITKTSINKGSYIKKFINRTFEPENAFVLNTEELATVYHLPSSSIETPNISWVYSRKSEPPASLPTKDCVYLGETAFRSEKTRFGLLEGDDRLRHMYLIGKSGTGKSTLFEGMMAQDIKNGHGVGILDPHGETVDKILERIPDDRVDDVIYFDPSDTENPVGLNLLQIDDPSQKNLLASGLVSAMRKQFDFSWGPRLEYLLNYAVLTLLEVPGTTMLGITRVLEDQNYQNFILHQVKDPVVRRFWEEEWKNMKGNQRLVTEAVAPIQNKINRFLASSTMRNILGQKKSSIDIWNAMNEGKILLINLSKGKIGADNANLLGAMLVSRIQFYALQRANIPYEQRRPFYLYVDEFQNFATGSFEEILSESRKYKLGLYLTHQFTAQLPEELLDAVYGNVGTIASFSLGAPDAKALANEFAPYFTAEDIISLERFEIYIKLMIDGMTSTPFSAKILQPWLPDECYAPKTSNKERVLELSRKKYGADRAYVEEKTRKWVDTKFDKGMAIALEYKRAEKAKLANSEKGEQI